MRERLLTRRTFLAGASAFALLLPRLLPSRLLAASPYPGDSPAAMLAASTVAAATSADPRAATRAALALLGGMGAFVGRGARVAVKPNIGWDRTPEQGANTHPQVVRALCEMCLEAGASTISIFDRTCNDARRCYATSGMEEMVRSMGDRRVLLAHVIEDRFRMVPIPRGVVLDRWPLYGPALDADVLINVPVAKHHGISGLTLAMKNLMGVAGGNRGNLHGEIGQKLADLATVVRPALNVLDATRILLRNGPTGGSLSDVKGMNKVAASTDIVAIDSWGAALFGMRGADLPSVAAGARMGLGEADLSRVRVLESAV
jgi:uncharacterized protein (DUF362 family)